MYAVYILRCADDTFYVGHTADLEARLKDHDDGRGCAYTAKRRPVHLAYSENFETRAAAAQREKQLKKWSAAKKSSADRGRHAVAARARQELPAEDDVPSRPLLRGIKLRD